MNLYLISQTVNDDYDTYSDAVVAAESIEEARLTHPDAETQWSEEARLWYTKYDGKIFYQGLFNTWATPDNVKVVPIGIASKHVKAGVVCASYHAG